MYRQFWLAAMLAVAALLLVACGGAAETAAPAPQTLPVTMNDMYFGETNDNVAHPPTWTVASGAVVTVEATNNGALPHNWTVLKAGVAIPATFVEGAYDALVLTTTGTVEGGESDSHAFTAPAPGEYLVVCTIPGHYPLMQGRLIVK